MHQRVSLTRDSRLTDTSQKIRLFSHDYDSCKVNANEKVLVY